MSNKWASNGDINLDVMHQVQNTLTVGMIMTPRADLQTCSQEDSLRKTMKWNTEPYNFIPVINENDMICGLFEAQKWFNKIPPDLTIAADFQPLSESIIVGSDASIFEFIQRADVVTTQLVVSRNKVAGLISLSDLQKLPVRAALFTLVTSLEIVMAKRISQRWPNSEDWVKFLSPNRAENVELMEQKARKEDGFGSKIVFTQLADKATIIGKGDLLGVSNNEINKRFRPIEKLRNDIAHASDYASTPDAARDVCAAVRNILQIKQRLLDDLNAEPSVHGTSST